MARPAILEKNSVQCPVLGSEGLEKPLRVTHYPCNNAAVRTILFKNRMAPSHDDQIRALVHSCADMSADERERYLASECHDDPELQRTVEMIFENGNALSSSDQLERSLPSHYRLIRLLGAGGMAEVFLAEDTRLGRPVAIKFLNQTFRANPDLMRRFHLEARAASALNHPNIITIHDIGETDGVQYIVSEYIDGESLRKRLKRGRLSVRECLEITKRIASALQAAHAVGIVHRDLKPDNIMLRQDGSVKVVDFGLAKAAGNPTSGSGEALTLEEGMTSPGMILGTPSHMSPEQARGLPVDGRTDIFSLGTIMYEMLTGRSPFAADSTADIIAAVLHKEPPDITEQVAGVPDELKRIIEKALEKDRDKRYASVEELAADLDEVRSTLAPLSDRITANGHAEKTLVMTAERRPPYLIYSAIAVVLLAALLFGGWRLLTMRSRAEMLDPATLRNVPVTSWPTFTSEGIAAARFSPDGRMIAFTSKKSGASEIYVKLIAGGEIPATKNGFENNYPVWSPDGQKIAFLSTRNGSFGIWMVSFTGGPETELASGVSSSARLTRWAADGTIFIADDLGISELDGSTNRVPKALLDFTQLGIKPRAVAVSADGKTFAVSVREGGVFKIKIGHSDESDLVEIASAKGQVDQIVFSPDGKSVFYSASTDGVAQIFEASTDGKITAQITNGASDATLHDVSSDGSRILYSSVDESSDLWQATVADGKESVIANDVAEELWPDISPDGKSIAYQSMSQPEHPYSSTIFVKTQPGGAEARPLSPDGFAPVWSNDGQWIAYFHRENSQITVRKIRSSGADGAELASGVEFSYFPTPYFKSDIPPISWSPDDSSIAFVRRVQGVSNIWLVKSDSSGSRQLTSNTDLNINNCCAVWTHDGSHLAWVTRTTSAPASVRLWLISSDGKQQKMITELNESFRFLGFAAGEREALIAKKGDPTDRSQTPTETNIYAVSIESGSMQRVATINNAYFSNIQLSRDGRTIAFVSRTGNNTELWTVPAVGGQQKKILTENDPKIMFSSLAWAPDGSSIAFGKQTRTNLLSMLTKP